MLTSRERRHSQMVVRATAPLAVLIRLGKFDRLLRALARQLQLALLLLGLIPLEHGWSDPRWVRHTLELVNLRLL